MTDRPGTTDTVQELMTEVAWNYQRDFVPTIGEPIARRLVDVARPVVGERVLDVACGTGIVARLATEHVGSSGTVAGVDPNPGMIAVARNVEPTAIEWHEAPAEAIPLPDASVDVVLCSMGAQFFSDKDRALQEMRRVLAPAGRVAWCTPGPTPRFFEAIEPALSDHIGPGAAMFVHTVFSLHDPNEARSLMDAAGFDRIDVEIETMSLRVAPPADFFWQYVHSTPLAAAVADLDHDARASLEAEVVDRCSAEIGGDAQELETRLLLVTGHRGT